MSRQSNFRGPVPANGSSNGRPQSKAEEEKGMWSSMLDSVASGKKLPEKNIVVLGGSPETQKEFLETLASDAPKRPQDRHRRKPVVANEFALGYTYQDVLDADHEGNLLVRSVQNEKLRMYRHPRPPINLPSLRARAILHIFAQTTLHASINTRHPSSHATRLE